MLLVSVWAGILFWKQSSARGRSVYLSETLLCILTGFAIVSVYFLECTSIYEVLPKISENLLVIT